MKKFLSLVLAALCILAFSVPAYADSPVNSELAGFGSVTSSNAGSIQQLPSLSNFIASLPPASPKQVTGAYVSSLFAYKVVQQPAGMSTYISIIRNTVTQFSLAAQYGTTAFIAHDYLSGALFFNLAIGQQVNIVSGDGSVRAYRVSQIRHFLALSPYDPYSSFTDMDNGGGQMSSTDLFLKMFGGGNKVVFMTCIYTNGSPSGGRLFVTATPM